MRCMAGIDKFADWITDNRSTFFVSSYTPHTAPHNAYLERLLRERSVPYSSELRSSHLQGMVTFLPAGDISHRDFVSHACWADYPIKDILVRMDDAADQRIGKLPERCRSVRLEAQSLQGATKRAPRVLLAIRLGGVSS